MLGPAPIALDFAVPVIKEDFDTTQVFSFNAELPF
jgi:outer membrane protein assembly factor BamA